MALDRWRNARRRPAAVKWSSSLTLSSASQRRPPPTAPRAAATDAYVRSRASLTEPCLRGHQRDLRWVLLHLINIAARHAGHADATPELHDGTTGE